MSLCTATTTAVPCGSVNPGTPTPATRHSKTTTSRPKVSPNGRLAIPELPSFRDATAATKTILTELRNEYDDVPAQQVEVSGPNGRSLLISFTTPNSFMDLNDDELLDHIRKLGGDWVVYHVPLLSEGVAVFANVWYLDWYEGERLGTAVGKTELDMEKVVMRDG